MKPLSSPQPLSSLSSLILLSTCPLPSHHLLSLCLYPLSVLWHTVTYSHFVSFPLSFHPPFLRVAVLDSQVVALFPVRLLFLVFASSISAKPMSPPLPQQIHGGLTQLGLEWVLYWGCICAKVCTSAHACMQVSVFTCAHGASCTCMCGFDPV